MVFRTFLSAILVHLLYFFCVCVCLGGLWGASVWGGVKLGKAQQEGTRAIPGGHAGIRAHASAHAALHHWRHRLRGQFLCHVFNHLHQFLQSSHFIVLDQWSLTHSQVNIDNSKKYYRHLVQWLVMGGKCDLPYSDPTPACPEKLFKITFH